MAVGMPRQLFPMQPAEPVDQSTLASTLARVPSMAQMGEAIGNAFGGPSDPSQARQMLIQGLATRPTKEYRNIFDGLSMLAEPMLAAHLTNREEDAQKAEKETKSAELAAALQGRVSPDKLEVAQAMDGGPQALAQGLLGQTPKGPMTVKAGEVVLDPNTMQPLYTAPPKPASSPELVKLMEARDAMAPDDPRRAALDDAIRLKTTRQPPMQVNFNPEKTGNQALAKLDEGDLALARESAQAARAMLPQLQQLQQLALNTPTGIGQESLLPFKKVADAMGIPVEGLTEQQMMQSIVSEMTPRMRPPGSGATSDMEMRTYQNAIGGLGNTQEANLLRWSGMMQLARRSQAEADFMTRYFRQNGYSLDGVQDAIAREMGPLFPTIQTPEERDQMPSGTVYIAPNGTYVVRR